MNIVDNERVYDSDWLFDIANNKLQEYDNALYKQLHRLCYLRYVNIRNILSNASCQQPCVNKVKELVKDENNIKRINKVFGYDKEEINIYVKYIDEFMVLIK